MTLRALELGAIDFVAKPKIGVGVGVGVGLRLLAEDITDKGRIAAQAQLRKRVAKVAAGSASASPQAAAPLAFGRLST